MDHDDFELAGSRLFQKYVEDAGLDFYFYSSTFSLVLSIYKCPSHDVAIDNNLILRFM